MEVEASDSNGGKGSVCREFFTQFPKNKERRHVDLTNFMLKHPSTSKRIQEWIEAEAVKVGGEGGKPLNFEESIHDDSLNSAGGSVSSGIQVQRGKCNEKSRRERELGNDWFKKRNLVKSLLHYNEAIKVATFPNADLRRDDDSCLPIAFANRSAVFNELGGEYFENALNDVDYALKFGYPEKLQSKLLLRKAGIYSKQRKFKQAQECIETITDCEDEKIKAKIKEFQDQIRGLQNEATEDATDSTTNETELMENENFENASRNITIKTSKELGRHVVANEHLHEGDNLFCETPYASVLLEEFYRSHCHHCHKPLYDLGGCEYFFPCSRCAQVKFCDGICSDAAELYHRHECGWLGLMHDVGIAHLALRIVLATGVDDVLKCVSKHKMLSSLDSLQIFKKGESNYARVYSLLDHIDDMPEEDLFQYSLTAGLLTTFLKTKTDFFHGVSEVKREKVGGVILRHICQLICNAHAVTDVVPDDAETSDAVVDEYQKRIATAIYPAASIMNHSCNPNINFYFKNGKQLIVKASRDIERGKEVYNCYGPNYRRMPVNERQEILEQQYFFTCACDICMSEKSENAPSFVDGFSAFKCSNSNCEGNFGMPPIQDLTVPVVLCEKCGSRQNVNKTLTAWMEICEMQRKGDHLLTTGDIVAACETFLRCFNLADKILHKFNSQYGKICDSLARCCLSTGKMEDAKTYLTKSLRCVVTRFGPTSVEFQRESRKYSEIFNETFII